MFNEIELNKFNQAQKAEKKLHIIGIDLDYFCHNIKALISIFSQSKNRNEFASILKKLQEIPHKKIVGVHTGYISYVYPMESWKKIRKDIIVAYQDAPDFFKNKLDDNIYYLERILGTYSYTGPSSESFKYNNFIAAHQLFGQLGKYFINYGANHVRVQLLIEGLIQGQMLAAQLMHEKKSPFRNKVISVGVAYSTLKKYHNRAVFIHMEKKQSNIIHFTI